MNSFLPSELTYPPKLFLKDAKIGSQRQGQKLMIQVFGMAWSKTNDPNDEVNNLVTFFTHLVTWSTLIVGLFKGYVSHLPIMYHLLRYNSRDHPSGRCHNFPRSSSLLSSYWKNLRDCAPFARVLLTISNPLAMARV